ncbi:MAG: MauE/DoxX family redox-associated membrane protein [Acidimicrobiia bacterium]
MSGTATLTAMLEGWYFITVALLVLSGGSKVRDPEPTRGALRAARLPSSRGAVVGLAAGEITVGAVALAVGTPFAPITVAAFYLGFAGFVSYALLRNLPLQSCGCFGKSDTPPGWMHVGINLSAATVALVVAATGGADLLGILADQPAAGIPYVGFVALGATLVALMLSELPSILVRRHP